MSESVVCGTNHQSNGLSDRPTAGWAPPKSTAENSPSGGSAGDPTAQFVVAAANFKDFEEIKDPLIWFHPVR